MQTAQEILVMHMHPNQSVRFNAASIVGAVAAFSFGEENLLADWSLIMSPLYTSRRLYLRNSGGNSCHGV